MPEEINRILTDSISDYLFVTERSGIENLKREGVPDEKIFFVGNVMIDSLSHYLPKIEKSDINSIRLPNGQEFKIYSSYSPPSLECG